MAIRFQDTRLSKIKIVTLNLTDIEHFIKIIFYTLHAYPDAQIFVVFFYSQILGKYKFLQLRIWNALNNLRVVLDA